MDVTVSERCAGLLQKLGADLDPFRVVWLRADDSTRRMLLGIAKLPRWLSVNSWDDLSAESRGQIKTRAADLHGWLSKALKGGE